MDPIILGELPEASYPPVPYAGAPYAPGAVLGSTQTPEAQVFAPSFVVSPPAPAAPPPAMMTPILQQSAATPPEQLYSAAPPVAAPPAVVAAPPAGRPAPPPQTPRAAYAGTPRLSEVGQIQTEFLKGERTAAYEGYARGASEGTKLVADTEAAQAAEMKGLQDRENVLLGHELQAMTARDEAEADQATRRTAAVDARTKLDAARTELETTKIDVDAAYGGTSGRIFSGLAVAMGAFGASMTGGPNYALQIVDARINREIDAQKSEIEKKKGKVSELGQILTQNEKLLGDADQARNLTRAQSYAALLASTEAKINIDRATPQQMLVLDALKGKVAENIAALEKGVKTAEVNVVMVGAQEREAQRRANANAAIAREKREEERREKVRDREGKLTEIALKGQIDAGGKQIERDDKMTARTIDLAKSLQTDSVLASANLYDQLAKGLGMDPSTGKGIGNAPGIGWINTASLTDQGAENRQLLDQLIEATAKAAGGTVTESDRDMAKSLLRGTGTAESIRRGVFSLGQKLQANIATRTAGDPQAMTALQERVPMLGVVARIGQQSSNTAAAGFSAAPPPPGK